MDGSHRTLRLSIVLTALSGRALSQEPDPGIVSEPRWLPPLETLTDTDPAANSRISDGTMMPLVPHPGLLFFPYCAPKMNMTEQRYRTMYEEIIFSGTRRFAVPLQDRQTGQLLDVAIVLFLADARSNEARSYYIGEHVSVARARIKRVLNPSQHASKMNYMVRDMNAYPDPPKKKPTVPQCPCPHPLARLCEFIAPAHERFRR